MTDTVWHRLQRIDPRIIYVFLIVSILIPLFIRSFALPIIPSQQSLDFYNTVQSLPANKLVIVDGQWSPASRGENAWQTQAILIHLMQRHLHFAILSFDPKNNQLTQQIVDQWAPKYGYVYGRDYVNWGYRPVFVQTVKGFSQSIPGTIKTDYQDKPIASFPVMQGIKNYGNIGAIVEITPAATADVWIALAPIGPAGSPGKVPLLFAPTAVMAPTYYPYIDSGQISGMLTGIKGAGDYEKLIGVHAFGTRAMGALSLVYALIIAFIILGNIGYYAMRRAEKRMGG